ncbi:twin-arginine translocase subunit TatC [Halovenus salina]|uniref:Sec-independent protein translocase protein TatC n=1 Tax=Halovenus salina TaxID=1510225 RepID=A0ABD5VY68_9EURY
MADGDEETGEPGPSGDADDVTPPDGSTDTETAEDEAETSPEDESVPDETADEGDAVADGEDETQSADSETQDQGDNESTQDDETANEADGESDGPETQYNIEEEWSAGGTPEGAAQAAAPAGENDTFDGAPDDEEMPLTEHIEEMIKRLAAVIVVMGGVSLLVFPVAPDLINWLWYSYLPGSPEACEAGTSSTTACPRVYHPLGLLFSRIKVASLVGFVIALPVFVYQTYLFMRPGLYPHERRYYLAAVPTSLLLAFVGLAFSYFLVLPVIFTYFLFYSEDVAEIAFGLTETFDLILLMMGMFAAIFQIPLFIMLAIMMGVTTRHWLEQKRYYFWLGFAGFAFIFSPDPTGMAPFIVGITMVALYELTLLLLRWTGR